MGWEVGWLVISSIGTNECGFSSSLGLAASSIYTVFRRVKREKSIQILS
jgi:hypothetical protein